MRPNNQPHWGVYREQHPSTDMQGTFFGFCTGDIKLFAHRADAEAKAKSHTNGYSKLYVAKKYSKRMEKKR